MTSLKHKAIHESYLSRKGPTALLKIASGEPKFHESRQPGELFNRRPPPNRFQSLQAVYATDDKRVVNVLARPPDRTRVTDTHKTPW